MGLLYKFPIFTRDGEIFAYELLVKDNSQEGFNNLVNFLIEEDVSQIFKDKKVVISLDYEKLNPELIELLKPRSIILKISLSSGVRARVLRDLDYLKEKGFSIILGGFDFNNPTCMSLLKGADYLSISAKLIRNPSDIKEFAKGLNKKILINEIESKEDYEKALKCADLLQGSYLAQSSFLHHYKNYRFLSVYLSQLAKRVRKIKKEELHNTIESDENLKKLVKLWKKELNPDQDLDPLELKTITFLYSIKDIFVGSEGYRYLHHSLFRAFLMREFAKVLFPKKSRKAFIVGFLSSYEEFFQIPSVKVDKNLEHLLSNVYLIEACIFQKEGCEETIREKLSYLLGISPQEIKDIVEKAKRKTNKLLTLLRKSEVQESKDLRQRSKLTQL